MAVEFAARGPSIRFLLSTDSADVDGTLPVLDLTGQVGEAPHVWRLTDRDGLDVVSGAAATRAVLAGRGTLEVQVRTGGDILSAGTVKVRRRVGGTISSALEAMGPLLMGAVLTPTHAGEVTRQTGDSSSPGIPSRRRADVTAVIRTAAQAARGAVTCWRWSVARWPADLDVFMAGPGELKTLRWFGPRRSAFWADPHVVVHDGQEWLFVEDLDRSTGLGSIRATQFLAGELRARNVVLATGHHLSFPQVYRVHDRWLATVETCEAVNPVYTFDRLGDPWRVAEDVPALPEHLADPVLVFDADGGLKQAWGTDARLDPNAVFVLYDWVDDQWQRVDEATQVDVTRTRGGGQLDLQRGLRAVQDCGEAYGAAAEVLDLNGLGRAVRLVPAAVGRGNDRRRRKGVHTVTWDATGEAVWIDGWYRRATPFGAMLRLREQRHSRDCTG